MEPVDPCLFLVVSAEVLSLWSLRVSFDELGDTDVDVQETVGVGKVVMQSNWVICSVVRDTVKISLKRSICLPLVWLMHCLWQVVHVMQ